MKTVKLLISLILAMSLTGTAFGMSSQAHTRTNLQALDILQKGDEKQRWIYGFFSYHASRNGGSPQEYIAAMGPQPDNFLDTVIGGWWIGYRYFIEVQFLFKTGFTSYWHFTSAFRPGKNGDRYSGFAYPIAPDDGFFGLNGVIKTLLYNQEIKSGSYENAKGLVIGLKDIFQIFTKNWLGLATDFYNGEKGSSGDWGIPGAPDAIHDYQTQNASTDRSKNGQYKGQSWRVPSSNWDDIQDTYFNPGANAGQYWYNQFTHTSSFDSITADQMKMLGYATHWIADGATAQHVWSTTDHYHVDFESFMDEMIGSKGFVVDKTEVENLIIEFEASGMTTYAQKFANGAKDSPKGLKDGEVSIKDLKINGQTDPTLYSAGDILRWLAEKAVTYDKVLVDDSETTFTTYGKKCLTLAVAGEILLFQKAVADLYKKKQYERLGLKEDYWGYGTWAGQSRNQIR
jgi:hypothetical protein